MNKYNPKAPNELADKQLNREQYESKQSQALAKENSVHYGHNIDHTPPLSNGVTNKESYNTIPGE